MILSDFSIFPKILLPKGLSNESQEKIILKLSNQIFNLLEESFWVLLTIDWIEYCHLLFYIKINKPFDDPKSLNQIKDYLINLTSFKYLKDAIRKIESEKVLFDEYIATQYYASGKFHSVMATFVKQNMSKTVKRYNFIIEKISGSKPKGKDIKSFAYTFLGETVKKINTGFLMTYKLNGDPYHLLSYMKSIFYKAALTEINKMQNIYSHSEWGISYKTAKQYIKDINKGKIHIGYDIIEKLSVYDLTSEIVEIVSSHNKQNQKHEKTGFITQRTLLTCLQNEVILDRLKKNGHPLKKYGAKKLKDALKELKQDKKIIYKKEKNAGYYRQADVPAIADELIKYFNTKRKK
ncbi:MAG: hypothetical protein HOC24_10920 [Deltaproteobacteria bacterium]|nr:hypothetical protein [Deltaproteobacteria bacterium]